MNYKEHLLIPSHLNFYSKKPFTICIYSICSYILRIRLYLFQGVQYPPVPRSQDVLTCIIQTGQFVQVIRHSLRKLYFIRVSCSKLFSYTYRGVWIFIRESCSKLFSYTLDLDNNHIVIKWLWNIVLECVNCLKL